MALRNILTEENPALRKVCRPYTAFDERLHQLLDDMKETLSQANGVGLAARQVGIIRRACIVMETNVPEGEDEYFIELVNPEIIERDGEQEGGEGCLSLPERYGVVKRPNHVKVRAQDRNGNTFEVEGHRPYRPLLLPRDRPSRRRSLYRPRDAYVHRRGNGRALRRRR